MAVTYVEKRQAAMGAVDRFNDAMEALKNASSLVTSNSRVLANLLGVAETKDVDYWKSRLADATTQYSILMAQELIEAVNELTQAKGAAT